MSGPDPKRFAAAVARLLECEDAERLQPLVEALRCGAAFDFWLAVLFRPERPPLILGADHDEPGPAYDAGPYLLDPFYLRYRAGEAGWSALSEIAPAGFGRSDYMAGYYNKLGMVHELGFLAPLSGGDAFHLSLTRRRGQAGFVRRERDWLEAMAPLVAAAGRGLGAAAPADPKALGLRRPGRGHQSDRG